MLFVLIATDVASLLVVSRYCVGSSLFEKDLSLSHLATECMRCDSIASLIHIRSADSVLFVIGVFYVFLRWVFIFVPLSVTGQHSWSLYFDHGPWFPSSARGVASLSVRHLPDIYQTSTRHIYQTYLPDFFIFCFVCSLFFVLLKRSVSSLSVTCASSADAT